VTELFAPTVVAYVSVVVEPYGQFLTVAAQDEMVYVVVKYTTVLIGAYVVKTGFEVGVAPVTGQYVVYKLIVSVVK
jgi:hypothetical protein